MTDKILVIGSRGMLGSAVLRRADASGWRARVYGLGSDEIDIREPASIAAALNRIQPSVVIDCAAWTDVEACETPDGYDAALRVNADGAAYLAEACAARGITLVHISSDYVFNGTSHDGVTESDVPTEPMNAYGKTKRLGEERILAVSGLTAYIVRTSWLFGPGAKNFVAKVTERARANGHARVVTDEVGCPTLVDDLADALFALIEDRPAPGIYHLASPDACSRFEFAQAVLQAQHINVPVEPCLLADFPRKARIAHVSILKNTKRPSLPAWRSMVARFFAA